MRFAAARTPGPTSAEEVLAGGSDKSPQSGAIVEPRKAEEARGCGRGPPIAFHSAMVPGPGFFCNFHTCGAPCSCAFSLTFHSQQLVLPKAHAPKPSFQHPATPHDRRHATQPGVHRAAAQTRQASSCFPQTICGNLL